jgi:hypothetical protein
VVKAMGRFPQVRWTTEEQPGGGTVTTSEPADVVVLAPGSGLTDADRQLVASGAGLVVVGSGPWDSGLSAFVAGHGIDVGDHAPERAPLVPDRAGMKGATDENLLARVVDPEGTVGAHLSVGPGAAPLLRTATGAVVAAVTTDGPGRMAVVTADLGGEPWARALLENLVTWCAPPAPPVVAAEVLDSSPVRHPAWAALKEAVAALQPLQATDGSVPEESDRPAAAEHVASVARAVEDLAPLFPHDARYLEALVADLHRWVADGLGVPDFLDSLVAFQPQEQRVDGLQHLVVFPMYTQNGSRDRHLEAVLIQVIWPDFVAELEAGEYSNRLFVPIRFLDFTAGYDTNSAVLFPETVAMRSIPTFTWGAIFADREAARFRRVVRAAAETTGLALPPDAARLVDDQQLAEETFVMWDLIHDRTHMRGDLPFDPFMIKQRMPYFLYSLEELRCDLTAFRESVALEAAGVPHARLVQYAVIFDRIFRFAITGSRVRNYDGLGGQLLFAWLHQHHVLHWTDNRLSIDWEQVPEVVLALGRQIEDLYWRSIDRPKVAHWLAAYELVATTVTPHPASTWAKGPQALPLTAPLKEMTDAVLPDEFPLSMFYEALTRRIGDVVASTSGITGVSPQEPAVPAAG